MSVQLIREQSPVWDEEKSRLFALFPGRFSIHCGEADLGQPLGGNSRWYRIISDGSLSGYAWWVPDDDNSVEIELCVEAPGGGVGTEALALLEMEARQAGILCLTGSIRPENPNGTEVAAWLQRHGFAPKLQPGWSVQAMLRSELPVTLEKQIG